jgi:predicted site-specific integrase-resolvase
MEQELLSKKELLERYGISYGALYRWKRKGLIPEDWFIKKSTVTGQETFFPKTLICERVELIMGQKEDLSLDELAGQINQNAQKQTVLTIKTVYGDRAFSLSDIQAITLDKGNGEQIDLTNLIK